MKTEAGGRPRYQVLGLKKLDARGRISLSPKLQRRVGLEVQGSVLVLLDGETGDLILRRPLLASPNAVQGVTHEDHSRR